jgi:hypothetical protein
MLGRVWVWFVLGVLHLIDSVDAPIADSEGRWWLFSTTLAWIRGAGFGNGVGKYSDSVPFWLFTFCPLRPAGRIMVVSALKKRVWVVPWSSPGDLGAASGRLPWC